MTSSDDNLITITTSSFGFLKCGQEIKRYVLKNQNNFEVSFLSYGAIIQSIYTKEKSGKSINVALGLNNIDEYQNPISSSIHFGGIIGRTSNRISKSEFTLDGLKYKLDRNDNVNSLHGGFIGFDMRNWDSQVLGEDTVKFSLDSPDGEAGYPGNVSVDVIYRIDKYRDIIYIEYRGKTDKSTPLDMTNHTYFNLNGHDSDLKVLNHEVKIFADNYLVSNPKDWITTGEINSVENTKLDFRDYTKLKDRMKLDDMSDGYNDYFIVNQQSGSKYSASVKNPENGLVLDIYSDSNGLQFYTGTFLDLTVPSSGIKYGMYSGLCFESHNYPDSVNKKFFPSIIVRPEGEYSQKTIWSFRVEN